MAGIGVARQTGASAVSLLALVLVSTIVALAFAEGALRVAGYKPWSSVNWMPTRTERTDVPLLTEKHPERGWANKPGKFVYAGYSEEVESITVTILPDEGRLNTPTAGNFDPAKPAFVFIGGSNTFGHAVSDHETYPWKLQARYPDVPVYNYAVGGYGTFQSLLTLEEKLPDIPGRKIVFYGMLGHHLNRNVVDSSWVEMFSRPGKGRLPPYGTLAVDGSLQRNPVSDRVPWPLKDKLALVNTAEKAWIQVSTRERVADKVPVMEQILQQLRDFSAENDAELVVILLRDLGNWGETQVREYLVANDFQMLDCTPEDYGEEYRVKNEGHPNDRQHERWADCVSQYLNGRPDIM